MGEWWSRATQTTQTAGAMEAMAAAGGADASLAAAPRPCLRPPASSA